MARGFTTYDAVFTLIARGVHSRTGFEYSEEELYLPSLRGEFTAEAELKSGSNTLYLPSLRGEFTAKVHQSHATHRCIYPHCEGSSQPDYLHATKCVLYLPSLRGEFTA